jgi:23S rRNA (adenine2503-C2)-methyltransferase
MEMIDCRSLTDEELRTWSLKLAIPKFRGTQIFQWVQQKAVSSWDEISNIGKDEKEKLKEYLDIQGSELVKQQKSKDGTRKFLWALKDGQRIETVLMDYEKKVSRDRTTLCISTQVGCAVGCSFCATGQEGFKRNLSVGEITGQVLDVTRIMREEDPAFKITNLVFMGMGEPFLNYEALPKAIEILNSEKGQNIGRRKMTISTSGVVPKIIQLAKDNPQVGLAISLHSARNEIRDTLVPLNRKYPLNELLEACDTYTELTGRRVTYEMVLHEGNTNKSEALELAKLLQGRMAHVNLIPINPVAGSSMLRPSREKISAFKRLLEEKRISVSLREEKGLDIEAACGQLRRGMEEKGG